MQKAVISLVLIAAATVFVSAAQTQDPKSNTDTKSRARTVATNTTTPAEEDVDNPADPVASLRDEISAAATDSERFRLQLKLADLLAASGDTAEALAELHQITKSNSFDPVGHYNLGNAYARLGETEFAINAYRTAIEQRKGRYSRASNNLGVVLFRTGRWDEANDALLAALKNEGFRYAEASYNLGRVYAAQGQNDLATREWRRALLVDPQHAAAAQALALAGSEGRIVVSAKDPNANKKPAAVAATFAPKPLTLDQNSYDYLQRGRDAFERGKMIEAISNFERVLKLQDGYFPPANLELGFALLRLKRNDEALATLLEVTKRDGVRYPISYYHVARLYELQGELKLAEAAYSQAATAPTTSPQFLLDLSRVREKLGDFKGALEAFENFLKLSPERVEKPVGADERLAELRAKATRPE